MRSEVIAKIINDVNSSTTFKYTNMNGEDALVNAIDNLIESSTK
jgi:hypothetical protein